MLYALKYFDHLSGFDYFQPWIDESSILIGQDRQVEINNAIRDSNAYVFLIDDFTYNSNWQKEEIDIALSKTKNSYIIPIVFEQKYFKGRLSNFKGIHASENDLKLNELSDGLLNIYNALYPDQTSINTRKNQDRVVDKNFKIISIKLDNIKCFQQLEIQIEENNGWIMLLGDNASGKSTILKCIGIGLSNESEGVNLMNLDGGNYIRRNEKEGRISLILSEIGELATHTIETIISKEPNSNKEIIRKKMDVTFDLSDVFICGYGTNRLSQSVESFSEYSKIPALKSLFTNDAKLQNPELILLRNDDDIRGVIEKNLLEILMLDPLKYGLQYLNNGLKISGPWGSESFSSLSDGYRMTSQWVLDFISWAIYAQKFLFSPQFGAILLLDEIELQLHPLWQKEIVKRIRSQFPEAQIITTTHTPLIASSLADIPNARLIRLKLTNDGEIEMYHIGNDSLDGLTANEVLNSIAFEVHNTQNDQSLTDIERYIILKEKKYLSKDEQQELDLLRSRIKEDSLLESNDFAQMVEKEISINLNQKLDDVDAEILDLEIKNQLRKIFKSKE